LASLLHLRRLTQVVKLYNNQIDQHHIHLSADLGKFALGQHYLSRLIEFSDQMELMASVVELHVSQE
jgi:hypothetical protein